MFTKSTSDQGSQRDQMGETKTVPDETKEVYGKPRPDHDALDTGGRRGLKERVDAALERPSEDTEHVPTNQKGEELREEGFKVGQQADHHGLAARKQP
ncbi:hypothetical protein VUR80DRAFT_7414 [Thermomyces stellatus]